MDGSWQRALAAWLSSHKAYPEAARQQGAEGTVAIRFTVDRSGHVLDVTLVRSAGSAILDAAAELMLRNASLPPLPETTTQPSVTVTVQIHYTLTH